MASQFRDSRYSFLLLLVSSLHLVRAIHVNCSSSNPRARELAQSCNVFHGSWVLDGSYPLYDSSKCPYIDPEFDCKKYGRPDSMYLKYKWKPASCELPKFNGRDFLWRMRRKKIMFVGDSISYNQWQSLICMLHAAEPWARISFTKRADLSNLYFVVRLISLLFPSCFCVWWLCFVTGLRLVAARRDQGGKEANL